MRKKTRNIAIGLTLGLMGLALLILPSLKGGDVDLSAQVAQGGVIKLYDQVLELPECRSGRGEASCEALDGGTVRNPVRIERFVSGSGYLAVFFENQSTQGGGANGGFTLDNVYFEPNAGERINIGAGEQVFERGNVIFEFDQPYSDDQRFATRYDITLYFLPHSELERQTLLARLQEDPQDFFSFKNREKDVVSPLCDALRSEQRSPSICPNTSLTGSGSTGAFDPEFDPNATTFTTNPALFPELDFSGEPARAPEVEIINSSRQAFVGEPVTISIDSVYDPDGKCQFFQYTWQKPTSLQTSEVSVNQRLGDLFFIPQNTGVYTLSVQAREACAELGTRVSNRVLVRLLVTDKSTVFPDLIRGDQGHNALLQLFHLGVVQGNPDGSMRPNDPVNRAEFLKMVFETLQYRIDREVFSPRYSDVPTDAWFSPYVHKADTLGVIKGYPDGEFKGWQTVNLVEALKMVMNFSTIDVKDGTVFQFKDVSNLDWFSRYVQTAFREGVLDLQPDGYVRPGQSISRSKAALIIVRTLLFPVNRINVTNKDVLRRPDVFEDFSAFTF